MKGFILANDEETVAVINLLGAGEYLKSGFWDGVKQAIADHYVCSVASLSMDLTEEQYNAPIQDMTFTVDTFEETENSNRKYTIKEVAIY